LTAEVKWEFVPQWLSRPALQGENMPWSQALTRVNPTVYDSVAALCNDPATTVVVFSGSDKARARSGHA
jgi:hypothetical protein